MDRDHIIFDCEIKNRVQDVPGGWDNPADMGVSCAVVYEYLTDRYRIYGDTEKELRALKARIEIADRIGGFNIRRFDIPLIWKQSRTWRHPEIDGKVDDLLERIWIALGLDPDNFVLETHGGWGLDAVGRATFGRGKIGHGENPPIWYQAGQWYKVVNYCVDDTTLEKDLSDYIDQKGYVQNPKKQEWPLLLSDWKRKSDKN